MINRSFFRSLTLFRLLLSTFSLVFFHGHVYNKNLDSNQRILAFNKRIDIRVNDYTAYIINKAFK